MCKDISQSLMKSNKMAGVKIYVKDYADAKFGCFPVAQPNTCHYRPRELPGRGTKGPGIPRDLPGKGTHSPV